MSLRLLRKSFKLFFISLIIFFIFGELFCRFIPIFRYEELPKIYKLDKDFGPILIPGSQAIYRKPCFSMNIKINSHGLRDREFPLYKEKDTYRILALGDSFTFGTGVDNQETYPKYLEGLLNSSSLNKNKYEVINAAVFGWGPYQEYIYLKEKGMKFKPDLIIVGFCTNDIEDVYSFEVNQGMLPYRVPLPFKEALARHSYFYRILRILYNRFLITLGKRYPAAFFDSPEDIFKESYPEELKIAFKKTEDRILKMKELSLGNDVKIIFVFMPTRSEVLGELDKNNSLTRKKLYFFNREFIKLYNLKIHREIYGFLKEKKIPTVDPLAVFKEVYNTKSLNFLYFWCDGHFTPEANRLVAQDIYDFLLSKDMLH